MSKLRPRKDFLAEFQITPEAFDSSGLSWENLTEIHDDHVRRSADLEQAADYISNRLRRIPEVHAIKSRVKDPEHLIEPVVLV